MSTINQLIKFLLLIISFVSYSSAVSVQNYLKPATENYRNSEVDSEPIFTIMPVYPNVPDYSNDFNHLIQKPNVKPYRPKDNLNYNDFYLKIKYVGKTIIQSDDSNIPPSNYIKASSLPNPYRILTPDSVATMDYDSSRLNVAVNSDFKVTDAYYG